MPVPRRLSALPLTLLLACAAGRAHAEDPRWALCPAAPAAPDIPAEGETVTRLSADEVVADREGLTTFSGDVVVLQSGKRAAGARAEYRREDQTLQIQGDVKLDTRDFGAEGRSAHIDLASDTGRVEQARYRIPSVHASGEADRVELLGKGHAVLHEATYTTCPPEQKDWELKARTVALKQQENTGEAWDARVEFKGVPLLYLPYINFPLAGRKSGLLVPTYGQSQQSGTDLRVPYYFNLAPNRDATLAPRWLSDRGLMLESEYRYLIDAGSGQLNLDYLPNDDEYGADRYYFALDDKRRPAERWSTELHYREVSDPIYFNDLDDRLETSSITHLDRRVDLRYGGDEWSFLGRVQALQTLTGIEPYRRTPQLRLDYHDPARSGRLSAGFASELVHFSHKEEESVEGGRLTLEPDLALPLRSAAWFATPRIALHHSQYQLDRDKESAPGRTLPIASIDSGAFFERDVTWGDRPLVQTLEPRLFYLYVPYDDQSDIPLFDTAELDFSFAQLFRDNRFSGGDRIGDANQLTAAVTSRLLDAASGAEAARVSVGQIHYFQDRRVTLPGEPPEETGASAYIAELGLRPLKGLDFGAALRWDPEDVQRDMFAAYGAYLPEPRKLVSVGYRYRENEIRQADLLALWPVGQNWRLIGRWNYDLREEQPLETVAGVEYQSCCWALRVVGRGRLNSDTQELDHSILVSIELKGLSSLGESPGTGLEHDILR